jgi:hypothetical protein
MKKLVIAMMIAAFSVSASAYACDGMKDHANKGDNPAPTAKQGKEKADKTKSDQKS